VASITAVNPETGDQVTSYTYGTTLSDSDIATSTLKRYENYPDSVGGSDRVAFKYNRQRQVKELTDQNGTVHSFDFDKLGRATQDRITTLGSGVDGAVRRLATRYEVRGMRLKLSSYDNATVGSGSLVNEVQFAYNDFGQLIADYQSHSGAVNTGSTPKVQYGYANGSANTIRPTSLTYPNGRVLSYDYGTAGGIPDAISRIDAIKDGGTALAQYSYLGLGTFVITDYTEPDIKWILNDLSGTNDPDTGDIYSGFDRFGRVKDNRWYNYGGSADTDRIKYGYDRAGNRIWRQNTVATSLGKAFDELYSYDGIHRLKDMQRGTLNAGKTGITGGTSTFAECWGLDTTGNWSNYRQDDDGDGSWDLIQNRANNPVNEITNITESTGPSWITPAYDAAGNMTTIPKPANPAVGYTGIYDAWNRLTAIKEGGDFVAEYAYDGAKRRTIQKTYTAGVLSETRHFLYTDPKNRWQVIEERLGSSIDPDRQFIWGLRYIDDLVLRDRDTDANGSLDERLYALQDANWNVTAVTNASGTVQERYAYSAYGVPIYLDAAFVARGSSSFAWETLYAGYRWSSPVSMLIVRHRIMMALLGLWCQRDLVHNRLGSSLYVYCDDSPLVCSDPSGLVPITCSCVCIYENWVDSFEKTVDCKGSAKTCCNSACQGGLCSWDGDWHIVPPPPPPPFQWPGYGNYCGPRCGEPKKSVDCIDAVCRDHDECLGSFLDWINPLKYAHCQMQMCADLAKCDCSKSAYSPSECKTAKYYMMLWACVGGALPIPGL
jgi:YD repeat-containing protein